MKKVLHFFFKALFVITMVHGVVDNANALPTYSRKYKEKCSFCHSVWPQLNRRGESFKINGYQLPKTPDGDTKGKAQLSEYSFLDIEDANPPVSAELQVSIVLDRDKKTKALGAKDSRRALLGSTRNFSFYASSTLNKNIAWFAKIKLGGEGEQKTSVEQGYLTINNLDKYQAVNLEIGISNLKQHSVITRHRNALPLEMTRTFGGLTGSSEDSPTLQLFGTPNGNILTYSLGVTDISGDTNNNTAIGGMLRLDFRSSKFAISYNYLGGNMTGINGSVGNSGGEAFDRLSAAVQPNQVHTHFLATRKDWGALSQRFWLGVSTETNFLHNFSVDAVERDQIGYGTDFWLFAHRFEAGAGFDIFQERTTKRVLWTDPDGSPRKRVSYFKLALAASYLVSENAKIGFSYLHGGFENDYLRANNLFNEKTFSVSFDLSI